MGGYIQPQAHVQLVCNMVDYGMDPQMAIDAPRFNISPDGGIPVNTPINFEEGWKPEVLAALTKMGHPVALPGAFSVAMQYRTPRSSTV